MKNVHTIETEQWRDIEGYEGLYQVSNLGRVKSLPRSIIRNNGRVQTFKERIMSTSDNGSGYLTLRLSKNGVAKSHTIHSLVLHTFDPREDFDKYDVGHLDENKHNNKLLNLKYQTHKENIHWGTGIERMALGHRGKYNNSKISKTVVQCSLEGNVIAEFPSVMEIERKLGYSCGYICDCCNGKKDTAYGFKWKYV